MGIWLHSFACKYLVVSVLFIKKDFFFPIELFGHLYQKLTDHNFMTFCSYFIATKFSYILFKLATVYKIVFPVCSDNTVSFSLYLSCLEIITSLHFCSNQKKVNSLVGRIMSVLFIALSAWVTQ